MLTRIDHIGIAVHSIVQARRFYENVLGLVCEGEEEVASQQVRIAFFRVGAVHLELLEPLGPESPVARFLARQGQGIHHIAYRSDDLEGDLARAASQGCRLIHARPVAGAGGKQVAFMHPDATFGVLTELCSPGHPGNEESPHA